MKQVQVKWTLKHLKEVRIFLGISCYNSLNIVCIYFPHNSSLILWPNAMKNVLNKDITHKGILIYKWPKTETNLLKYKQKHPPWANLWLILLI